MEGGPKSQSEDGNDDTFSIYQRLLGVLRAVFEDEKTPFELVQDQSGKLWAVAGGTILAEPGRGIGVIVCSPAVLPMLYRVDVGLSPPMSFCYFADECKYLDPISGEWVSGLPAASFVAMIEILAGTDDGDRAHFDAWYTKQAAAEIEARS